MTLTHPTTRQAHQSGAAAPDLTLRLHSSTRARLRAALSSQHGSYTALTSALIHLQFHLIDSVGRGDRNGLWDGNPTYPQWQLRDQTGAEHANEVLAVLEDSRELEFAVLNNANGQTPVVQLPAQRRIELLLHADVVPTWRQTLSNHLVTSRSKAVRDLLRSDPAHAVRTDLRRALTAAFLISTPTLSASGARHATAEAIEVADLRHHGPGTETTADTTAAAAVLEDLLRLVPDRD